MKREFMLLVSLFLLAAIASAGNVIFVPTPTSSFSNTKSLSLIDSGDHMSVPHAAAIDFGSTTPFSISFWFYETSSSNGQTVMGKSTANASTQWYLIANGGNNRLSGYLMPNYFGGDAFDFPTAASQFSLSTWYHVLWTYDGSKSISGIHWYLNGVSKAASVTDGTSPITNTFANSSPLWIGHSAGTFSGQYVGQLDEISMYNVELTSGNATTLYNSGHPGDVSATAFYSNCVAWWRFEDNTNDSKGTNNGTLASDATYSSNVP